MLSHLIKYCIEHHQLSWQKHALARMLERDIYKNDVRKVLLYGEIIEQYSSDRPFPSFLMYGVCEQSLPLHVVASIDEQIPRCYIITAYRPDTLHFEEDLKTRRK